MRFPIFASFIIFVVFFTLNTKRVAMKGEKRKEAYWEKETRANNTRRKSLDNLDYVVIPFSSLPMDIASDDETIQDCLQELTSLKEEKIVNFTGISNTDLKLKYGVPNLPLLIRYDQNYTLMVRTLQNWAKRLYELGFTNDALCILEFAISTRSDVSSSYYLAAKIYSQLGKENKISYLKRTAESLNSAMRNSIVRTLQESYPNIG